MHKIARRLSRRRMERPPFLNLNLESESQEARSIFEFYLFLGVSVRPLLFVGRIRKRVYANT